MESDTIYSKVEIGIDNFGSDVSLSGDGNWLAIGDTGNLKIPGKVYIYKNVNGKWELFQTIIENTLELGTRLSFNEDGSKLVVNDYIDNGYKKKYPRSSVYTYKRIKQTYKLVNILKADISLSSSAISGDGLVMTSWEHYATKNSIDIKNRLNIYHWSDLKSQWNFKTSIENVENEYILFGYESCLDKHGKTLLISSLDAINDDSVVYVYTWNSAEFKYERKRSIRLTDEIFEDILFGYSTDINNDGTLLYISSSFIDVEHLHTVIYKYRFNNNNNEVSLIDEIYPGGKNELITFNNSISASNDGSIIAATVEIHSNKNNSSRKAVKIYTF